MKLLLFSRLIQFPLVIIFAAFFGISDSMVAFAFSDVQCGHGLFGSKLLLRSKSSLASATMIYTPSQSSVTLQELKEQLDRQIEMPSSSRESSTQVVVPRSPCTSLYGNWRPTTGTEPWNSGSKTVQPVTKPDKEVDETKIKRGRGRPAVELKAAVKPELLTDFVIRAAQVLRSNGGRMDSNLFGQHWKNTHPDFPLYDFKSNKGFTIHQMLRENGEFFSVFETDRQKVKIFELKDSAVQAFLQNCESQLAPVLTLKAENLEVESEANVEEPSPAEAPVVPVEDSSLIHFDVPVHGRARMANIDRRLQVNTEILPQKVATVVDDMPVPPLETPNDALIRPVISLYNSWAVDGRDVIMELTHQAALDEILALVKPERELLGTEFTVIDAGCGNGWAARRLATLPHCCGVVGVDAAALMVARAIAIDEGGIAEYVVGDVQTWTPKAPADLVLAQELLYFVDDPHDTVKHLVQNWLAPGGRLVAAVDCFRENKASHAWAEDMGVPMHCLSEAVWKRMFKEAGLQQVDAFRSTSGGPWQGTLILTGVRR